jgi:hypothetical protein
LTDAQKRAWKDLIGKEIAPEILLATSGPKMHGDGGVPVPLYINGNDAVS